MGKNRRSMQEIAVTNLSGNDVPIISRETRLSDTPKGTPTCIFTCWIKSLNLPMK